MTGSTSYAAPPRRPLLVLVLLAVLQMAVSAVFLETLSQMHGWSAVYAEDSAGYLFVTDHLLGEEVPAEHQGLLRYRLFNPLVPALATAVTAVAGVPVEAAFLGLNVLFWIAGTLVFYRLVQVWEGDDAVAFAAAVLFTTSLPLIEWGLPVMVDAAAYSVAALVALLVLRARRESGWHSSLGLGVALALALLVKPTLLTLVLFAGLALLAVGRPGRAVVVGALAGGLALAVYLALGLTVEDFTSYGAPRHRGPVYLATAAFFCFHWGWLVLPAGWRRSASAVGTAGGRVWDGERVLYPLYFVSFLLPFLIFVHSPRLFFLAFPAILPLVARGLGSRRALVAYAVTSNLLAVVHLYVMRTLRIRDLEQLLELLG